MCVFVVTHKFLKMILYQKYNENQKEFFPSSQIFKKKKTRIRSCLLSSSDDKYHDQ